MLPGNVPLFTAVGRAFQRAYHDCPRSLQSDLQESVNVSLDAVALIIFSDDWSTSLRGEIQIKPQKD